MKDFLIKSARVQIDDPGIGPCGPIDGAVIVEVLVQDKNGNEFFVYNGEFMGIPNFFKSETNIMPILTNVNATDEEIEELNKLFLPFGEYDEILEKKDPDWFILQKYIMYLVSCEKEDEEPFIQSTVGKWLSEIEIPKSVIEEDLEDWDDE